MVPVFCDQVGAKLVVEFDTGKRNLEVSLDIVQEKCTGRFFIVGSELQSRKDFNKCTCVLLEEVS